MRFCRWLIRGAIRTLVAAAVVVFAAAAILGLRSTWITEGAVSEVFRINPGGPSTTAVTTLTSSGGSLEVFRDVYAGTIESDGSGATDGWVWTKAPRGASPGGSRWYGWWFVFSFSRLHRPPALPAQPYGERGYTLRAVIPYWAVIVTAALPPSLFLVSVVRRRRARAAGKCVVCGYDLRASSGRCPECGIAPSKLGRGG